MTRRKRNSADKPSNWLKADLTYWGQASRRLGPSRTRPIIVRTLSHWRQDADLAGIRDSAALVKLPVEEQTAFSQLWVDVAALLKMADEKPQ